MNSLVQVSNYLYIIFFFFLQKWILILINTVVCNALLLEAHICKNQRTPRSQKDHLNKQPSDSYRKYLWEVQEIQRCLGWIKICSMEMHTPWPEFILSMLNPSVQHSCVEASVHLLTCNIHLPWLIIPVSGWLHKAHHQTDGTQLIKCTIFAPFLPHLTHLW